MKGTVQNTVCGRDNATAPPCEMDNTTPSPSGMDITIFSSSGMDNATPSPCRMNNHYILAPITQAITTVDTLLPRVFVPPCSYDFMHMC